MMKSIPRALASAIVAFATLPALAADFTFVVPVDVSNLPPEIGSFHVSCAVGTSAAGGILQSAFTNVTVRDRGYRGDVTVDVNVAPARRAEATHYQCEIRDFNAAGINYLLVGPRPLPRDPAGTFRNATDFNFIPIPR